MKNLYLLLGLLAFASCTQDELVDSSLPQDSGQQEVKGIVMTGVDYDFVGKASRSQVIRGDKSLQFQWKAGDQVGIFPMASKDGNTIKNEGTQVTFPMADGAGTNQAKFDGGGWALKSGYTYASYFPLIDQLLGLDKTKIPVSYDKPVYSDVLDGNTTIDLGDSDFMTAEAAAADASGNINFEFHHTGALIIMNVNVGASFCTKVKSMKLTGYDPQTKEPVKFIVNGHVDLTQPMIAAADGIKYHQFVAGTQLGDAVTELVFDCTNAVSVPEDQRRQLIPVYFTMAPQELANKMLEVTITFPYAQGKDRTETTRFFVTKNIEPGKAYIWNTHIGSEKTFFVDEPGTLATMMPSNYAETSLTVKGRINDADLEHIKKQTQLELMGIYAAIEGKHPNQIPAGLVDQMPGMRWLKLPFTATSIAPDAFKNFSNAASCELVIYSNFADLVQIAEDGKFMLAGAKFKTVTLLTDPVLDKDGNMIQDGYMITDPFYKADAATHTLNTKYDDMVCAVNIGTALGEGTELKVTGKLSDRDIKAIAGYSAKIITSLTFENVGEFVPTAESFDNFSNSEACDLVIPEAWRSLVTNTDGKVMFANKVWKSIVADQLDGMDIGGFGGEDQDQPMFN